MELAAVVAAEAAVGPEASGDSHKLLVRCMKRLCQISETPKVAAAALKTAFATKSVNLTPPKAATKLLKAWNQGRECGTSASPSARYAVIPNPSAAANCKSDEAQSCGVTQHQLWPVRVATSRLEVGDSFHATLSGIVIQIYKDFSKTQHPRARAEDINNAFFQAQLTRDSELTDPDKWPELYESTEYKQLRTQIRSMAVAQAEVISIKPRRVLERCDLSLWAAVYTEDTPHLTHVHESSVVSGSYYSQAPPGSAPIVFTDPRGGQSMHADAVKPENEPEAPFMHTQSFFPNTGDLVIFPSWLPHRVPPAPKGTPPRVSWAFNLQCGDDSWLWTSQ
eukprot:TRINITY_DN13919_c0_g1_i3.p1 TRINITY_DN13919_c0_g1~~TRINITY_DN13919_c0_g1_i3.p1  ORF type:complete len:336 (+),score=71.10 TRINITY_DN13919_c0_g1_i3:534-1541(+)